MVDRHFGTKNSSCDYKAGEDPFIAHNLETGYCTCG